MLSLSACSLSEVSALKTSSLGKGCFCTGSVMGSKEPGSTDWAAVERVVALCQHAQAVLPETKSALKGSLRSSDVRRVLGTLTVRARTHWLPLS